MEIINRETISGKYRVTVLLPDGNTLPLKYQATVTDAVVLTDAQKIIDRQTADQTYNAIPTVPFNLLDNMDLLKEFVAKVKATPTMTLAQYNTWLATKPWYQLAIIKYFVFILAVKLADSKGLILTDYSEQQVLAKLRDWIAATNLRTIGKVIGYGSPND